MVTSDEEVMYLRSRYEKALHITGVFDSAVLFCPSSGQRSGGQRATPDLGELGRGQGLGVRRDNKHSVSSVIRALVQSARSTQSTQTGTMQS